MSRIYEFIRECGVFFVLTMNGDFPAGRPFGAIMESGEDLYISTANTKDVYRQMKACPQIQILALKAGTRDWMRVNCIAEECSDAAMKARMLRECPVLTKHFPDADAPAFALFRLKIQNCNN